MCDQVCSLLSLFFNPRQHIINSHLCISVKTISQLLFRDKGDSVRIIELPKIVSEKFSWIKVKISIKHIYQALVSLIQLASPVNFFNQLFQIHFLANFYSTSRLVTARPKRYLSVNLLKIKSTKSQSLPWDMPALQIFALLRSFKI